MIKFDAENSEHQPEAAYWMAWLSKLAYEKNDDDSPKEKEILQELKAEDHGFISVKGFDCDGSQAIVVSHNEYNAIAFRGTDENSDWLKNMDMMPTTALEGRYHNGFYNATMNVWGEILEAINTRDEKPVWITGHSLGGAMACVATASLITTGAYRYMSTYTFGQPRCMDEETALKFQQQTEGKYFRYRNNNDVVTDVPSGNQGYKHIGTLYYIKTDGKITVRPSKWDLDADRLRGFYEGLFEAGIDYIEDHAIDKYLTAIRKNLKQ